MLKIWLGFKNLNQKCWMIVYMNEYLTFHQKTTFSFWRKVVNPTLISWVFSK